MRHVLVDGRQEYFDETLRFLIAGNVLRGVETAGWCFREGRRVGAWVAAEDVQAATAAARAAASSARATVTRPRVRLAPVDSTVSFTVNPPIAGPWSGP